MNYYSLLLLGGSLILSPLSFFVLVFLVISFLFVLGLSGFGSFLVAMIVKLLS